MTPFRVSEQIIKDYERGFRGVYDNPQADADLAAFLQANGGYASAGDAITTYGLAESGSGKVSLPYLAALYFYPNCLPGGAQGRGSCVAWNTRNAALVSYCSYLLFGQNVEKFRPPVVSPVAIDNGVASTEAIYWFRHHSGDGWQGSEAAQVAIEKAGLVLRQKYPDVGLDLTEYNAKTEGQWGMTEPPENVRAVLKNNLVSNATVCKTYNEVRDMLANGFALSTTGSEAFTDHRDAYGACNRSNGTWFHAMAAIAVDDREEIVSRYGGGLICLQNSWGNYLSGPDKVMGTNFRIPTGSFWARWKDVSERYFIAMGPAKGWPASRMPDWGLGGVV